MRHRIVVAILVRLGTVVVDVVVLLNSVLVVDVDVAIAAVCVTAMIVAEGSTYRRSLPAVAVMSVRIPAIVITTIGAS